ncbi:MAG: GNAT family N-acetyltransferase [Desulfobacterales bacterium]|nr:GNAT family N-acetyltransferase [Desulfobacterales bacterium]
MLGKRSVDILATAFIQPDHDLSHQHANFAEQNQTVVGMVSGYTARRHHNASDQPLKQAAGRYNLRFLTVSLLFAPLMRILDTIVDDDFYLQAIALDKELRGQGLGSVLMDLAEERAHISGSKRLSLDVSADNVNARKLYERRGMIIESQWPKRFAIPKLKFYRMVKVL